MVDVVDASDSLRYSQIVSQITCLFLFHLIPSRNTTLFILYNILLLIIIIIYKYKLS